MNQSALTWHKYNELPREHEEFGQSEACLCVVEGRYVLGVYDFVLGKWLAIGYEGKTRTTLDNLAMWAYIQAAPRDFQIANWEARQHPSKEQP